MRLPGHVSIAGGAGNMHPGTGTVTITSPRMPGAKRPNVDMMLPGGAFERGSCEGIRCAPTAGMPLTKSTTSRKSRIIRN